MEIYPNVLGNMQHLEHMVLVMVGKQTCHLKYVTETSDNQKVMTLTLDKNFHKIIFYKGSIGIHIN